MQREEGISRRIFIQSAAAAGISLVGLTGCKPDDDIVSPVGVPKATVPTLPFTAQVQPAAVPGVDAGTRYAMRVIASQGGTFKLPDGTVVLIPPGAFAADTDIAVTIPTSRAAANTHLGYLFEPSGLVLKSPIFVTLPLALVGPGDIAMSFTSSTASPVVNVGSERTNWVLSVPADPPAGAGLTVALAHFTFLGAIVGADKGQYLVTAIPAENLEVGDFVFFLTEREGKRWQPGHCAALIKEGTDTAPLADSPGRCVEMGGLGAGDLQPVELEHIQYSYDHVYLGPRRHRQGLTASEKIVIRDYWLSKRGTPYALIGDQGDNVLDYEEGFSCVSMCEVGLQKIKKGVFPWLARQLVSTPQEFFDLTKPVTDITVLAGKKFEMPVYGVIADDSESIVPFVRGLWQGTYSRTEAYDIAPLKFPPNSTFVPTQLPTSTTGGPPNFGPPAPGYLFTWTPANDQIGQTFELELVMVANRVTWSSVSSRYRDESRRTLRFTVVSPKYEVIFDQVDPDLAFGELAVNSTGSFAFGTTPNSAAFTTSIHAKLGDGPIAVIDTVNRPVSAGQRGMYRYLALSESADLAYVGDVTVGVGATLRFAGRGLPVKTLGSYNFLPVKLLPVDSDGKALLFMYMGGGDMASLDVRDPGPGPAPLTLKALSGQNFAIVSSFAINTSGEAYVSANMNSAFDTRATSFRYQYPVADGTPAAVTLIHPLKLNPKTFSYTMNEQGDVAYIEAVTPSLAIVIQRKDKPLLRIEWGATSSYSELKMAENGDLFALESGSGDLKLVKFTRDNTPVPEVVSDALLRGRQIIDYDVAGPYLGILSPRGVTVYQERLVSG